VAISRLGLVLTRLRSNRVKPEPLGEARQGCLGMSPLNQQITYLDLVNALQQQLRLCSKHLYFAKNPKFSPPAC